jgi:hypothetical protein
MAWTTKDLDDLKRAIATGASSVQYEDRRVTYRSLAEMLQTRDLIETELGLRAKGPFRKQAVTSKGLADGGCRPAQ